MRELPENRQKDLNIRDMAAGHLTQTSVSIPVKLCCLWNCTRAWKIPPKLVFGPSFSAPAPNIRYPMAMCAYSLMTQFDQVEVCGGRRQAADVQVGLAELLRACAAAVAAAAGTGRSHGVRLHTGEPLLGLRRSKKI